MARKGQTVIPAKIRRKYGMSEGVTIQWIDTGETLRVVPIPKDKIRALRGIARGENSLKNFSTKGKQTGIVNENLYLLDTSAWFTLMEDEEGTDEVKKILQNGQILIPSIVLLEVYYISLREKGKGIGI